QNGNNNAYCQDNEITWLNWNLSAEQRELIEWTKSVIKMLKSQPVLQRSHFFQGRPIRATGIKDISFVDPSGKEMDDQAWNTPYVRCLGMRLASDIAGATPKAPEGDTLLLLLNAHHEPIAFTLPSANPPQEWESV